MKQAVREARVQRSGTFLHTEVSNGKEQLCGESEREGVIWGSDDLCQGYPVTSKGVWLLRDAS